MLCSCHCGYRILKYNYEESAAVRLRAVPDGVTLLMFDLRYLPVFSSVPFVGSDRVFAAVLSRRASFARERDAECQCRTLQHRIPGLSTRDLGAAPRSSARKQPTPRLKITSSEHNLTPRYHQTNLNKNYVKITLGKVKLDESS